MSWQSWGPWGAAAKLGSPGSHGKAGPQGATTKLQEKGPSFPGWLLWCHPLPHCPVQVSICNPPILGAISHPMLLSLWAACPTAAEGDRAVGGDAFAATWLCGGRNGAGPAPKRPCPCFGTSAVVLSPGLLILWSARRTLPSAGAPLSPGLDGAGLCGRCWASTWRGSAAGAIAEVKQCQGRMSPLQQGEPIAG